jgi:putative nucleotidyltransferase with HDIG domain
MRMAEATTSQNDFQAITTKALSQIGDIATLPAVTVRIIEIVENPKSTARDLHDVIKNDIALSTKVLKVVNSAFYGLPGQVASVDRAIVLLGLSAVKNIAIASSIARMFKSEKITEKFSASDLWTHSVAVAVASRALARVTGRSAEAEEIFLAGLIHDLGILVERQAFGDKLGDAIKLAETSGDSFLECERQIFGADHAMFGMALATKWKFPRHLRAVVGYHHNSAKVSEEMRQVVALVQAADIICCERQLGFYLSAQGSELTPEILKDAQLTPEKVEEACAQLEEDCNEAKAMLMA